VGRQECLYSFLAANYASDALNHCLKEPFK
jgi:hypothetical protein